MNESQESLPSTDQPSDVPEPVQTVPETPTENIDALETESQSTPSEADPDTADAPTTPPPTRPAQRPPRTQQILIIAVLVLIALSAVIFAIEVATQ